MKRVLVIAKHYSAAKNWATKNGLERQNWLYFSHPSELVGLRGVRVEILDGWTEFWTKSEIELWTKNLLGVIDPESVEEER